MCAPEFPGDIILNRQTTGAPAGARRGNKRDTPLATSLRSAFAVHALALDASDIISGRFVPAGARVSIDVQAAYAGRGQFRAALLLYVGQPEIPGSRLCDAGGKP